MTGPRRLAALLALSAALTAGCGLQGDALQSLDTGGPGIAVGTDSDLAAAPVDAPGDVPANPATGPDDTTLVGPGDTAGPADSTSTSTAPRGSSTTGTQSGPRGSNGSTTTAKATTIGVTDKEIRIGIHAPLSGASPLPQESFETGKDMYWKGKTVFGRQVVVEVLDDTYKPSGSVRACQEMARRDFIVLGAAGTDQIQACGRDRTLQRSHTPYLSAGVTENGLTGIPTYFALSLTYREQGAMVMANARKQDFLTKKNAAGESKWAVVISDTPNFKDGQQSIEAALKAEKIPYRVFLTAKTPSDADATALSNELRSYAAPVVYFLGQPTFFIKVVGNTANSAYTPIWTGIGPSMGVNAVVEVACPVTANRYDGRFLHPYQGFDKAPPDFLKAGGEDDIQMSLWLSAEMLHKLLLTTKGVLTRENFTASIVGPTFSSDGKPFVRLSKDDHFGGLAAYSLKSDCAKREYVTLFDGQPLYAKG
ncbi:MAG TPA: ABC transporter substrate-binding protein [Mycobacteriales bacterium]|nr:ABC transporter substrate-binding protein [Mycobacteriales bacterium]